MGVGLFLQSWQGDRDFLALFERQADPSNPMAGRIDGSVLFNNTTENPNLLSRVCYILPPDRPGPRYQKEGFF